MNLRRYYQIGIGVLWVLLAREALSEVVVIDDLGNEVVLAAPAKRVISLAPHLTEILFSLGVEKTIVGTSRYSDYPPEARNLLVVGDAFSVDIESIVVLRPDLIFAWSTGGTERALRKLRKLGFPIYLNEASSIDGIGKTVSKMGELTGSGDRGSVLAAQLSADLKMMQDKYSAAPAVSVFFQITGEHLYTVNGDHLIGQAIKVCRGENIFSDAIMSVPMVSKESVVVANPDLIVISKSKFENDSPWEKAWAKYPGFKQKLRRIDPGLVSRPSLRMIEGVRQLCGLIHGQSMSLVGLAEFSASG